MDGRIRIKLLEDQVAYFTLAGNEIFYINNGDALRVYKMALDGSGRQKISEDIAGKLIAAGDYIYYNRSPQEQVAVSGIGIIYRIKMEGTERQMVCQDFSQWFNVAGEWVYYENLADGHKLYKVKVDGTQPQKLNDDETCAIHLVDGWIYYGNRTADQLYRIRPDGGERQAFN